MIDFNTVKTPCYIVDCNALKKNLEILKHVKEASGCKILLAQKAFSCYGVYPLISSYLDGTTASSLHEAKLGFEEFGKETHIFSAAFREDELAEIASVTDHVVFNSFYQFDKYKSFFTEKSIGIRVNPEHSEVETELYNPCAKGSRLGILAEDVKNHGIEGIEGIHFHALCEQGADVLERVLLSFEEKFSTFFPRLKWVNFGGGHHITRENYDVEKLITIIKSFKKKYNNIEVYLEPGEAIALNAGYLVTSVLDIVKNGIDIAITDCSAECHMPDVIEMPYRPEIVGAANVNEKSFTYRISSQTCLAGDVVGDYSFDNPLKIGSRLVFCDMAIYSMVKNNTFNGINLPSIYISDNGNLTLWKEFGYSDFKSRL